MSDKPTANKTKLRMMFEPYLESVYKNHHYTQDLVYYRWAFLLFAFLFSSFGFLDYYMVPEHAGFFIILRLGVVLPLFIITIVLTYSKIFFHIGQYVVFTNMVVGGVVIAIMLITAPNNMTYYGGILMVIYSGFFLLKLPIFFSALGSVVILLALLFGLFIWQSPTLMTISAYSFFLGSTLIGIFGAYNLERYRRHNFLKEQIIQADKDDLSKRVKDQLDEIDESRKAIIVALAKLVESRDTVTGTHIEKTGRYCRMIAEQLGKHAYKDSPLQKPDFIQQIELSSVLHDIGKVGIPDTILNKPGPLTPKEFEIVKTHVTIGSETLQSIAKKYPGNSFINMGIEITKYHHERFDGTGYPDGLKGYNIPLSARIMALVDVYDALTSIRPYKPAYSHARSVRMILDERGKHFDPMIVDAFMAIQDAVGDTSNP